MSLSSPVAEKIGVPANVNAGFFKVDSVTFGATTMSSAKASR